MLPITNRMFDIPPLRIKDVSVPNAVGTTGHAQAIWQFKNGITCIVINYGFGNDKDFLTFAIYKGKELWVDSPLVCGVQSLLELSDVNVLLWRAKNLPKLAELEEKQKVVPKHLNKTDSYNFSDNNFFLEDDVLAGLLFFRARMLEIPFRDEKTQDFLDYLEKCLDEAFFLWKQRR